MLAVDKAAVAQRLGIGGEWDGDMAEGSAVVLFAGYGAMNFVPRLTAGGITQMRVAVIHHADCIGQPYGSRVKDRKTGRWVAALRPSEHILTEVLPHRTQIIYHADIYALLMMLDIKPGMVVAESGTGSASLTCHLARGVAPTGHVHTFEFHQLRHQQAVSAIADFGLESFVTCHHRDVYALGFATEDAKKTNFADALFLDLPQPWRAVEHAKNALKPGARLCSFSPCIEQVQRTERALFALNFRHIRVFEALPKSSSTIIARQQQQAASEPADGSKKRRRVEGEKEEADEEKASSSSVSKWDAWGRQFDQQQFVGRGHTSYLLMAISPPSDSKEG